ncbi:MAG: hypothetical protein RL148_2371 [Planctomycetota bacterium]|jgi:phosphate transport system permease protein
MLWLCGGALALALLMVLGLVALVAFEGGSTFWPVPAREYRMTDGRVLLGEVTRTESYRPSAEALQQLPEAVREGAATRIAGTDGVSVRELVRTGNYEITSEHFHWVPDFLVSTSSEPEWALVVERQAWGRFYGMPRAFLDGTEEVATTPEAAWARFLAEHDAARARFHEANELRVSGIGRLSEREEEARLAARKAEIEHGTGSARHSEALAGLARMQEETRGEREQLDARIQELDRRNQSLQLSLVTADGVRKDLRLDDIVRAYPANQLGLGGKLGIYLDRWREFLVDEPRESNSEGGVYPAIFGTVLMTLLMSIAVVPFGVLAALYLREYAKAGLAISAVRIAVNNLAGVPSIVFGVFGLGFFCYIVGGTIDSVFYAERLPNPTFGKGALLWASLTLALLTLPVVIVATEEALAAVPRSMREGSYACGASKWQTIRRIVLPRAMPGIMTGAILAMARGAGEVAPLMLVGAVKLAPELPMDGEAPFLHPSRSFMHLGFHVYDLGFQSQNSEAAKPMVFTTTLLLIGIITTLNVFAIWLRSRLRRRFHGPQF